MQYPSPPKKRDRQKKKNRYTYISKYCIKLPPTRSSAICHVIIRTWWAWTANRFASQNTNKQSYYTYS